jgi:GTPase-associated protein 1, N-terminal domain type 2/GTPase-associated protein 1, middle domain
MRTKVEFAQSYYTSCRMGLARRSGFQTKAISASVPPEARRLVEAYVSAYPSPRNRNTEEGQPVAFKSFSLGSQLWCISLTQYRKFDWTGEGLGNFFAHSLICSREDFRSIGADPFRLFYAGCFTKDDPGTSTELPPIPVEIPDRPIGPALDGLRTRVGGRERLRQLVDSLLVSAGANRPVIIVANPADVLVILEGLITVLPISIRTEISFSTYGSKPVRVDEPKIAGATERMRCSGTTGVIGETYSQVDFDNSYFIFDFENARFSAIPGSARFSDWVASRVFEGEDLAIADCNSFLSGYELTTTNLDHALSLYGLREAVDSRNSREVEAALRFAENESKNRERGGASVAMLLGAPSVPEYEIRIAMATLRLTARHGLPDLEEVYRRFLSLLTGAIGRGDRGAASSLLGVIDTLPGKWRAQLVADLAESGVPGEYIVDALASALRLGSDGAGSNVTGVLFTNVVNLLKKALHEDDGSLISRVVKLSANLSEREQILLPCELESSNALGDQVVLLERALGRLRQQPNEEDAAVLCERVNSLFRETLSSGRPADPLLMMSRVVPLMAPRELREFIHKGLDEGLDLLAQIVNPSSNLDETNELAHRWLRLLLQDDLFAVLPLDEPLRRELDLRKYGELIKQIAGCCIDRPEIEREEGLGWQGAKLLIFDSRRCQYVVETAKGEVRIWRLDPQAYDDRMGRVVDAFLASSAGMPEKSAYWDAIRGQLEQNRVRPVSPEFFARLCVAVNLGASRDVDRSRLYRSLLSPMLRGADDQRVFVRILLKSFLSAAASGEQSQLELNECAPGISLSIEDIREVYPPGGSRMLLGLYWNLLGDGRDRARVMEELSILHNADHRALFSDLSSHALDARRGDCGGMLREWMTKLPALRNDDRRLSELLVACRKAAGETWPRFVEETSAFFIEIQSNVGIAFLAKQCIERMRSLMQSGDRISAAEDGLIDKWLKNTSTPDPTLSAIVAVFREVQKLDREASSPMQLLEGSLSEFQHRKASLAPNDFQMASRRVLLAFANCQVLANRESWNSVEAVATQFQDGRSRQEFGQLIDGFLYACARRSDYPEVLAHATMKWMRRWADYRDFSQVLEGAYSRVVSNRARQSYLTHVKAGIQESGGDIVPQGIDWWQSMVDPPRGKGIFDRLFGR